MNINLFQTLYNLYLRLLSIGETIGNWLLSPVEIGTISFTPLEIGGGVVIAFLIMKLVKDFIPMA